MEVEEAQARMREIQRIMETATLFTLLPSTAAIVGGVLVFFGCGASYTLLNSLNFADIVQLSMPRRVLLCAVWVAIAVAAVGVNVLFTARLAARQRIVLNPRPANVALFGLTPCVVVATAFTLKFFLDWEPPEIRYIAPFWILLYGTGVYTAGLFSIRVPAGAGPGLSVGRHRRLVRLSRLRRGLGRPLVRPAARRLRGLHPPETARRGPMSDPTNEPIKPGDIDAVIHERARLAIVSALAVTPELSFGVRKPLHKRLKGFELLGSFSGLCLRLFAGSHRVKQTGFVQRQVRKKSTA